MSGKRAQLRQVAKHYAPMLKEHDGYKSLGETENAFGMRGGHTADEKTYAAGLLKRSTCACFLKVHILTQWAGWPPGCMN